MQTSKNLAGKEKSIKLRLERETTSDQFLQQLKAAAVAYTNAISQDHSHTTAQNASVRSTTPNNSMPQKSFIPFNSSKSLLFEPMTGNVTDGVGNSNSSSSISILIDQSANENGLERKSDEIDAQSRNPSPGKRPRKSIDRLGMVSTIEHVPRYPLSHGKKPSKSNKKASIPTPISEEILPETQKTSEKAADNFYNKLGLDGKGSNPTASWDNTEFAAMLYKEARRPCQPDEESH